MIEHTEQVTRPPSPATRVIGMLVAVVLIAFTLRAPITSVGSLVSQIRTDLGLSASAAGVLTTLPVLCLGAFAALAPSLRRRFGEERVLLGVLPVLLAGILLRTGSGMVPLLAGTVLVGAAIGVANVTLPSLIKRDFPHRVPAVTAVYSMSLTLSGAAAAGAVVPVQHALGSDWRLPLALTAAFPVLAMGFWVRPALRAARPAGATGGTRGLWRDRLAWQVTGFMGSQSLLAYVVFSWLPTMCVDRGMSEAAAGLVLSLATLSQVAGSFAVPLLCRRANDQRGLTTLVTVATLVALAGILELPLWTTWLWAVLLGLAQGAAFGLALTLIGLRAPDAHLAASLSAMAQTMGYLIAAVGPLAIGLLRDLSGGWAVPMATLLTVGVIQVVLGRGAGRDTPLAGPGPGNGGPRWPEPTPEPVY
ncbi:MFS transporter [Longimycelium tulufanense]|uniref:MFS transporter n=1 Tax=Longimycelium tulufanense TaxID=907463 RepID=A0A8J3CDE5_9PSEU|nr:MFS transporter [Longimycelium tulufanense]GGM77738.1 MFS transporter [Longimycelium tulufanense]